MKFRTILILALFWVGTHQAFAFGDGDFRFQENGTNCTLIGYTGPGGAVTIPSVATKTELIGGVEKKTTFVVTAIGYPSRFWEDYSNITSITIPNSVTAIGWLAFAGCSFASITIPNSVETIGEMAFWDCSSLASITIPNSVETIEHYAFAGCSSLASITIPNSVTRIGGCAFDGCSSLASITLSNSVKVIGWRTFANCSSLTSLVIPNSVIDIGGNVFSGCSSLASITIPNSVEGIGGGAFEDCSSLASLVIPNSVKIIGDGAFLRCSSLTSVTIPASVTALELPYPHGVQGVFESCTALTSVTVEWATPLSVQECTFKDVDVSQCTLIVPAGTKALYEAAPVWKEFIIREAEPGFYVELLSADGAKRMKGVAADGVSELKIRIKYTSGTPDVEKITVSIWCSDVRSSAGTLGTDRIQDLTIDNPRFVSQNGASYLDIAYHAPDVYIESRNRVSMNIFIYPLPGSLNNMLEYCPDIEIIRPPVMLVHGLNSSSGIFTKLQNALTRNWDSSYKPFQVKSKDYSATSRLSFHENTPWVIQSGLIELFNEVRKQGYEVKKADIVGHSMGGILTRMYMQSSSYRDDIYRLITLNTPHSGSQGANLIMDFENNDALTHLYFMAQRPLAWTAFNASRVLERYDNFVRQGAVKDLCVNSAAIAALNGMNLNRNIVPAHAIYTTAGLSAQNFSLLDAMLEILIKKILRTTSGEIYGGRDDLYNGANDLVVAVSSQKGGLPDFATSSIPSLTHFSTEDDRVINRIAWLLDSPELYTTQGYAPPTLTWPGIQHFVRSNVRSSTDSNIKITSIDKPDCRNGDEIKIRIAGSTGITSMSLVVEGENGMLYMDTKEGSNNEFAYTVPASAIGMKKVLAIGYTNSQETVVDTASIRVSTLASLLSIRTSEPEIWIPLNGQQQVQVQGEYSDGTVKNITYQDDVRFTVKGANATLEVPNILTGVKTGEDTLVIACRGFEIELPVHIIYMEDFHTGTVSLPSATSQPETLVCFPNPARDYVTVRYELPAQPASVILRIYDMQGKLLRQINPQHQDAGINEERINVEPLSKGIYIITLSSSKGYSYAKLLKE